ncbi:response regulator transcription factor [uncultured Ilumatobacter sp.]|uniref:response regulator transcription factor n=1 Tax=uncultured Ilumatobacter sp. TaxID=879968 RepID=UPI00374F0D99
MTDSATILMIEDEADIRLTLSVLLRRAGLQVLEAADGRSGLRLLHERQPDCVIVDIGLPDIDGWQVLGRIRDVTNVPVMMLTARHLEAEKVRGLQAGADDYLTKPFGNLELIARVRALLRRAHSTEPVDVYVDELLVVDPASHRVAVEGREVELTAIEFRLLHGLIRSAPQVLSPVQLLEMAWSDPTGTGPDRVKYVVHRLRRKMGFVNAEASPIRAVRGVGYTYIRPH